MLALRIRLARHVVRKRTAATPTACGCLDATGATTLGSQVQAQS